MGFHDPILLLYYSPAQQPSKHSFFLHKYDGIEKTCFYDRERSLKNNVGRIHSIEDVFLLGL